MNGARFVLSRSKVVERYGFLRGVCPNISYSDKTNPEVGRVLEEETDCMFSVHMPEGLEWIRDKGRVWFIGQAFSEDVLKSLFDQGICNYVIDNESDLKTFLDYIKKEDRKVNLLLRMKFHETTVYKGRYFLFGMSADIINGLIPDLRGNEHILKLGIHFHRKSQNTGNWNLKYMLEEMLTPETLESIDVINIGGGIPIEYKNTKDSNLEYILVKIRELREWLEEKGIEMVMEPGRPISGPAVKLETFITMIDGRNITVNCSVYNSYMDTIVIPHKLLVEGEGEGRSYLIKGYTPCSMDIFRYDVKLKNPKVGDRIVFLNAGAYNIASDFCTLKKPETVIAD